MRKSQQTQLSPVVHRLQQLMDAEELDATGLAKALGYASAEKLYRLFRVAGAKPSVDILEDISNKFDNWNMHWVLTGKGNKYLAAKKAGQSRPSAASEPDPGYGGPGIEDSLVNLEKRLTEVERVLKLKTK